MMTLSVRAVVAHLELICYGFARGPYMQHMIETESYLQVKGPFIQWRKSRLQCHPLLLPSIHITFATTTAVVVAVVVTMAPIKS